VSQYVRTTYSLSHRNRFQIAAFSAQLSVLSAASEEWPSGKLLKAKHRKTRDAEDNRTQEPDKRAIQTVKILCDVDQANKIVEKAAWNAGAHGVPRALVRLLSTFGQAP
jgi:RNA processing factor Prp31